MGTNYGRTSLDITAWCYTRIYARNIYFLVSVLGSIIHNNIKIAYNDVVCFCSINNIYWCFGPPLSYIPSFFLYSLAWQLFAFMKLCHGYKVIRFFSLLCIVCHIHILRGGGTICHIVLPCFFSFFFFFRLSLVHRIYISCLFFILLNDPKSFRPIHFLVRVPVLVHP